MPHNPKPNHTKDQIDCAQNNLANCIEAFDQGGEVALDAALDKVYSVEPEADFDVEDLMRRLLPQTQHRVEHTELGTWWMRVFTPEQEQGRWLTRHFDAPLSAQEQHAKLQVDSAARQLDLFASEVPDVPGALFHRLKM